MTKITKNEIELFAIELLDKLEFEYIYAPKNIAPDSQMPLRESLERETPKLTYSYQSYTGI